VHLMIDSLLLPLKMCGLAGRQLSAAHSLCNALLLFSYTRLRSKPFAAHSVRSCAN
jgi:hypothetical protein